MLLKNIELRDNERIKNRYSLEEDLIIIELINQHPERYVGRGTQTYEPIRYELERLGFLRSPNSLLFRIERVLASCTSLEDVAELHNVTTERVRKVAKEVIKKLKFNESSVIVLCEDKQEQSSESIFRNLLKTLWG